jgi:putative transposase
MEGNGFDPQKIAAFRFGLVGPLLAAPPGRGELIDAVDLVTSKAWPHPTNGRPWKPSRRTIERWYYLALENPKDPIGALIPKGRVSEGVGDSISSALRERLRNQYLLHRNWSYQLHADNIAALTRREPDLGRTPSYSTIKRYMKACGMLRRKNWRPTATAGQAAADARLESREVRSYEVAHVGGLWHTDFHHARRKIVTPSASCETPILLAFIDDHSRLILHAQWYFAETCEVAVHGLKQAIQKRGLPRAVMTDNGGAFIAEEFTQGLGRLSVIHDPTLPYSPYQNGKQESFWGQVEGRLMAMLQDMPDVTLKLLNDATMAWVEGEYNRATHSEIGTSPLDRFLHSPRVLRDSPTGDELRAAFRLDENRTQRQTDGTVVIDKKRFEIPDRFRHLKRLLLRYARWDLSYVDIVDPRTGKAISPIYPLDKEANASGKRRRREPLTGLGLELIGSGPEHGEVPPLLRELMEEYAANGLLPAYLPTDEETPR